MLTFDIISDIHLDKWFKTRITHLEDDMKQWVAQLLPSTPSQCLVFVGDFGEYNAQNIAFLAEIRKHYTHVLFVLGNNDLTLPVEEYNIEGFSDAKERLQSFLIKIDSFENVHYLNGTTFTYQGVTFGGSDIFFDFELFNKHYNFTPNQLNELWYQKKMDIKHKGLMDDPFAYSKKQKRDLKTLVVSSDVIITHGPPDYFFEPTPQNIGFYAYVGDDFKPFIQDKIWCFGHNHKPKDEVKYGCRFINTAVGKLTKTAKIQQIKLKTRMK